MDISISSLTTKELQTILLERGLPIYYKKKIDLIKRLSDFFKLENQSPNKLLIMSDSESETFHKNNNIIQPQQQQQQPIPSTSKNLLYNNDNNIK